MKCITIIIHDDQDDQELPAQVREARAQRYKRLDEAQERARLAAEWFDRCSCNPANGGSGICMCVNPYNQVWI